MKKVYEAPYAEKVNFNYNDQVVASNGEGGDCFYEQQYNATHTAIGCEVNRTPTGGAMNS